MIKLYVKASQVLREERAQDMVEYALVVGIIALGATAAMKTVSGDISAMFNKVGGAITNATTNIN